MRLNRLQMTNFRQHTATAIEFDSGLTGIIGQNGSGKSTILEAIAWALYGMPAARGTRESIRSVRAPARSGVRVELDFDLGGHRYRVVRGLTNAELYLDGAETAIANTITGVTDLLRRRLGMSLEEFFNTYFTGQKELSVMATMGPSERAQFLSRVLGYEKLRAAQNLVRDRRKVIAAEIVGVRAVMPDADKVAEGLREPMGIKVVDGDIYISEKHQLSKLIDADANGSYEAKDEIATWPFDGNFHEFAFGLLYKDGFFYLNLSVSIDLGGATTVPQGSDDRGTHLKINKDTGEIDYVAGGLRTPHGIGWGAEDEIFVTDNQGGWLPANKLIHIQPGQFYNHYTTGPTGQPGRFDDQRPTPPALWLPHNEIANSPSQPMLIPSGPFAGQMWVADVTYGGIQRAFLEKVEGEYQGAYFRMTQGLESGLTHLLLEDDGSIIVGGLGAGGNWGQTGKLLFGLQKLVPNGTETFDIEKMELADGGFDLTYTKPLSDATLAGLADKYRVEQWTYVPTAAYGGPKVAEESLTVTDASVSADRQTVSLKIEGLKPDRVVYVRSPRPFTAEDGEELLSTEAWYTLNKLPGYVAPISDGLYELEDGLLTGGAQFDTEHAGYSGTGFVSGFGTVGASVKLDVAAEKAGDYRMALRYANGPHPFDGPKTISLIVNGTSRQITLPPTGTWPNYQLYLDDVTLDAGANTIELKHAAGDDGHVNLDSLRRAPAGVTRYEAEDATLEGGADVQTEHAGYSGTGYVGGYQNQGASTTFEVTALADAPAQVALRYANGPHPAPGTKNVSLYVNGRFVKKLPLNSLSFKILLAYVAGMVLSIVLLVIAAVVVFQSNVLARMDLADAARGVVDNIEFDSDGRPIGRYFTPRPDGSPAVELRLWDALDMQLLTPDHMLHAGYLGALGVDMTAGAGSDDPIYPESQVRPAIQQAWAEQALLWLTLVFVADIGVQYRGVDRLSKACGLRFANLFFDVL
jgi:hypothetical protein